MRWKALAEIYKMHSFAPFSWDPFSKLNFVFEIAKILPNSLQHFASKQSQEFVDFRADFYRNFMNSGRINKNHQIFAENYNILSH